MMSWSRSIGYPATNSQGSRSFTNMGKTCAAPERICSKYFGIRSLDIFQGGSDHLLQRIDENGGSSLFPRIRKRPRTRPIRIPEACTNVER